MERWVLKDAGRDCELRKANTLRESRGRGI